MNLCAKWFLRQIQRNIDNLRRIAKISGLLLPLLFGSQDMNFAKLNFAKLNFEFLASEVGGSKPPLGP